MAIKSSNINALVVAMRPGRALLQYEVVRIRRCAVGLYENPVKVRWSARAFHTVWKQVWLGWNNRLTGLSWHCVGVGESSGLTGAPSRRQLGHPRWETGDDDEGGQEAGIHPDLPGAIHYQHP